MTIFRNFARDLFGMTTADVPETVPLRILGLAPPMPTRETIVSAFRRRAIEVHPDLQMAYDNPVIQAEAEALEDRPEIRELVWARDVLVEMIPDRDSFTVTPNEVYLASATSQLVTRPMLYRNHYGAGVVRSDTEYRSWVEVQVWANERGTLFITNDGKPQEVVLRRCFKCRQEFVGPRTYYDYVPPTQCRDCERQQKTAAQRQRRTRGRSRTTATCLRCGRSITVRRSSCRYCSTRCRVAAFRMNEP